MDARIPPQVSGTLRKFALRVPEVIAECSGIKIFGKLIRSLVFSTDVSIIKNVNADAVIAVYPFTPQPVITQALMQAADIPVFAGVGGGLTQGVRVYNLALHAEFQGAMGVVVNAPTSNEVLKMGWGSLGCAVGGAGVLGVAVTIVNELDDIQARLDAGASILNVSAAAKTAHIVEKIRIAFPDVPIIATGGPTDESIRATIQAGANAITWTPPSNGEIFKSIMAAYRDGKPHP